MNVRTWLVITAVVAGLLAGRAVFRQQGQLRRLRTELAQIEAARAAAVPPVATALAQSTSPAPSPLSEADKQELMRLRGEVARLMRRQRELAGVEAENASLRAGPVAGATNGARMKLPPGYVKRAQAKLAGNGSPEAALQSLFWSIEHRDTNQLFLVVEPDFHRQMVEELTRAGADQFWEGARQLPGYHVVTSEPRSDAEVLLQVQFVPDEPAVSIAARRTGGTWRLSNFDAP